MSSLIEIAQGLKDVREKLEDLDLPEEVIADTIDSLTIPIEEKATSVVLFTQTLEGIAATYKAQEEAIAKRRKAIENRAKSLKQYVFTAMDMAGVKKIETPQVKLQIVRGQDKVIIDAPSQIPPEYMRFPDAPPPEPDKKKMLDDLKAGVELDFAHLEPNSYLKVS